MASSDPADLGLVAGNRRRRRFRPTDDDRRDRLTGLRRSQQRLAFRRSQIALREADPASSQSLGKARQHQIFRGQRAILDDPGSRRPRGYHDQRGRVVEYVECRVAQMRSKMCGRIVRSEGREHVGLGRLGNAREEMGIAHDRERPGLLVDGVGRQDRRPDEPAQRGFGNRRLRVRAHRATSDNRFHDLHDETPAKPLCLSVTPPGAVIADDQASPLPRAVLRIVGPVPALAIRLPARYPRRPG